MTTGDTPVRTHVLLPLELLAAIDAGGSAGPERVHRTGAGGRLGSRRTTASLRGDGRVAGRCPDSRSGDSGGRLGLDPRHPAGVRPADRRGVGGSLVISARFQLDASKRHGATADQVATLLRESREVGICAVVGEFRAGISRSERDRWSRWLGAFTYWDISRSDAIQAGAWRHGFAREGVALSLGDAPLIAAVAAAVSAVLVTGNARHFPMPGNRVISLRLCAERYDAHVACRGTDCCAWLSNDASVSNRSSLKRTRRAPPRRRSRPRDVAPRRSFGVRGRARGFGIR